MCRKTMTTTATHTMVRRILAEGKERVETVSAGMTLRHAVRTLARRGAGKPPPGEAPVPDMLVRNEALPGRSNGCRNQGGSGCSHMRSHALSEPNSARAAPP